MQLISVSNIPSAGIICEIMTKQQQKIVLLLLLIIRHKAVMPKVDTTESEVPLWHQNCCLEHECMRKSDRKMENFLL